jgi:hypothetical protein
MCLARCCPSPTPPPRVRTHVQEVNDAINAANSWRELAAVLAAKGPQMDAENISAVLYKVRAGAGAGCAGRPAAARGVLDAA